MKNVKDLKIRILCVITAILSVFAVVPVMYRFFREVIYFGEGIFTTVQIDGISLYTDKDKWWFILLGVLGIVSLLWNLVYGAYALIDGRYRNFTWRIARYGYFCGIVIGIINIAAVLSLMENADETDAVWAFVAMVAIVSILEFVIVLFKDDDTKRQNLNDTKKEKSESEV